MAPTPHSNTSGSGLLATPCQDNLHPPQPRPCTGISHQALTCSLPTSLPALCLHPSPLTPALSARPCLCHPHSRLDPACPGPWPQLLPDHLTLFSLPAALLLPCSPALSGAALQRGSVPPRKKAHMGTGMCREKKRQQLLRQQARRGP